VLIHNALKSKLDYFDLFVDLLFNKLDFFNNYRDDITQSGPHLVVHLVSHICNLACRFSLLWSRIFHPSVFVTIGPLFSTPAFPFPHFQRLHVIAWPKVDQQCNSVLNVMNIAGFGSSPDMTMLP